MNDPPHCAAFLGPILFDIPLHSRGYEIESELMMKSLHKGLRIVEVPIHVPFAVPGVTVWDGFKVGWYKVKTGVRLKQFGDATERLADV